MAETQEPASNISPVQIDSRPGYLELVPTQYVYQSDSNEFGSSIAATMPNGMITQPSINDYVRTADEMSAYLTWQTMDVPPWLNFQNMFPPR